MRIALVTSHTLPEAHWHDSDAAPLAAELARAGVTAELVPWDGPGDTRWTGFDGVILQSPWSMWPRRAAFHRWLDARVADGLRLLNPADIVRLAADKRYLPRLAAAGVPTVATSLLDGDDDLEDRLRAAYPRRSAARRSIVVKPVASGGALGIREFGPEAVEAARAHAAELIATGGAALVQPYMETIDTHREYGVVTLGDEVSHAITKAAILRPGSDQRAFHPDPRPVTLTAAQIDAVQRAHRAFLALREGDAPPYSVRLDFLVDPASDPGFLLLEVEAVAPVKFFALHPDRPAVFARAVVRLIEGQAF